MNQEQRCYFSGSTSNSIRWHATASISSIVVTGGADTGHTVSLQKSRIIMPVCSAWQEEAGSRVRSYETEASAEEAQREVRKAEERARRAAATAEEGARKVNDDIEEMLQKMKRDLGIK